MNTRKSHPNLTHLIFFTLLSLSSCQKEGAELFEGSYSFKTSGTLTIDKKNSDNEEKSFKYQLSSESGQMNILKENKSSAIITMNIIGGQVLVIPAITEDNTLKISSFSHIINIKDGLQEVSMECSLDGEGKMYDDVVIINFKYTGAGSNSTNTYTITDSEVNCVAKRNE